MGVLHGVEVLVPSAIMCLHEQGRGLTSVILKMYRGEVVPKNLRVSIVPFAISTSPPQFLTAPAPILLRVVAAPWRLWWRLFLLIFPIDLLFQIRDKAIDFGLGF